jgi:hypothetical protein
MIKGCTGVLDGLLAGQFTATHITGYQQPKTEWLAQIRSGDFVYHSIEDRNVSISVDDNTAVLVGTAAVAVTIGGSKGTWNLESAMEYVKQDGKWKMASRRSSA